jgi:hypothetical protein
MDTSGTLLTTSILEDFVKLFRGRGDVYGAWDGGCVKAPLTVDKFMGHLQGDEHVGVYPLLSYKGSWYCVWGCSDIDVEDLDAARNLQMALAVKGVDSWVERTRKGYHVWVFADSMVPAATMRRALLAAHQAIDYPAKEVNPKQETVSGSGYGNYVRLPYPSAVLEHPRERYILDDNENQMRLAEFVYKAMETRVPLDKLESIANMWKPPQPKHIMTLESSADVRQILRKVGPIPYVMWRDGPMEGNDRSSTLFRLSCKMRDAGLEPAEALIVLRSADQRWGKFHLRPDGEAELAKIVERSFDVTVIYGATVI